VPSNFACTKTTAAGNKRFPKICVFFSLSSFATIDEAAAAPPAAGNEEEHLNALFADIVDATHNSGSKGLFNGFRKK
jgi:hypothetical protein